MFRTKSRALVLAAMVSGAGCHSEARIQPREVIRVSIDNLNASEMMLVRTYQQALPNLELKIVESSGSVMTVESIQRGKADVGVASADVAFRALVGDPDGTGEVRQQLRGIAILQSTILSVLVRANSTIRSIPDLRGRRVSVGPTGTGLSMKANMVLRAFGIGADAVRAESLPLVDAKTALIAGQLDAVFAETRFSAIPGLAQPGIRLLPIQGPAIDDLRRVSPFVRLIAIPNGVYPGQTGSVHTIAVDRLLVCRADLAEALVYDLTKQLFETMGLLNLSSGSLEDLTQASGTSIPLHDGAGLYYRHIELLR